MKNEQSSASSSTEISDINTTMGYKTAYPEEAIRGHRAFIAQRRTARPSEEYRSPTDAEWDEFLGHFERRKLALGDCGRAYSTPCIHEHYLLTELRRIAAGQTAECSWRQATALSGMPDSHAESSGPQPGRCGNEHTMRNGRRPLLVADRIAEAEREGWLGEIEGLKVSLAAATSKIAQADMIAARRAEAVSLGIPAYRDIAATTIAAPGDPHGH